MFSHPESLAIINRLLDAGSKADSVEMYSHSADYIPGADKASPIDEPELELELELDEGTGPVMKVTKKGKGSARALIASKREALVITSKRALSTSK